MQLHEVIRRHTQVVEALLFILQIDFHPLSPGHLQEGDVWVLHCSHQVENGRSFTGVVAVVGLLSAAYLQEHELVLNMN